MILDTSIALFSFFPGSLCFTSMLHIISFPLLPIQCFCYCCFVFSLREGLTVQPRLAYNSPSSCLLLRGAGITGMSHHAWHSRTFMFLRLAFHRQRQNNQIMPSICQPEERNKLLWRVLSNCTAASGIPFQMMCKS
jgi:hypothetical protein